MKSYETRLQHIPTKQIVAALVKFGISEEEIISAEKKWKPYRDKIAKKLMDNGIHK